MGQITIEQVNVATLIIFIVLVFLAIARISLRLFRYKKEGLPVPTLLPRDLFLFLGLGIPFLGGLIIRASGVIAREQSWFIPYIIVTNALGLLGVAQWVYYEFFVIEKKK